MTVLSPYLNFRDNAREAMEFYQSVLGGELTRSTFAEFGASDDPAERDKTMHAALTTPGGMVLMASDTPNALEYLPGSNFSLSLSGDDETELKEYWEKLSADGIVAIPLGTAPWGDLFGMCTDKFGIRWMVSVTAPR
jgi:PhnB protein